MDCSAAQFVDQEDLPAQENIEKQQWGVTVELLKRYRCGSRELSRNRRLPEKEYGWFDSRIKVSAMLVVQEMARVASFGVPSDGDRPASGTLPNRSHRTRLPQATDYPAGQSCTGEKISAYALSEAGSASDALAAKTNGDEKPRQGITPGGFVREKEDEGSRTPHSRHFS
jgi:hypothetical protein